MMYVIETLHFDISGLREAYVSGYGSPDPIIVHVGSETLTYTYE